MASILFVCTANICRSPYAAAALTHALGSSAEHKVSSAGVRTEWLDLQGEEACALMPAPAGVVEAVVHRARQLTADDVRNADVVVAFEAAHRAAVINLVPRAQVKTYTATQMHRIACAVAADQWPAAAPERSGDVLRDVNAARSWAPYEDDADIVDPHGGGELAHQACAAEIDRIVSALVEIL